MATVQFDREKENLIRDIRDGTLNAELDVPAEIRALLAPKLKPRPERAAWNRRSSTPSPPATLCSLLSRVNLANA